ncbi:MAG TPA: hypothetical protein PKI14_07175 [Fervidobacterium sp.]|nr:hypothetical protein [Fervidobacterium sp.]
MDRTLQNLIKRIREELRAEGAGGGGYSDEFIRDNINSAIGDLAEVFTIRDTVTIATVEGQNVYDLNSSLPEGTVLENIIKITYDGREIKGITLDEFLDYQENPTGPVRNWHIWGSQLMLLGDVEGDKELRLWITRAPKPLTDDNDVSELPYFTDTALIKYAISACFNESRDYERASVYFNHYLRERNMLMNRGIPQGHRNFLTVTRDTYWEPERAVFRCYRTDTNPGGR